MPNLGPTEIIVIALLVILLFGFKKLPDAARSVGRSMRVFKSEMSEMKNDGRSDASTETVRGEVRDDATPAAPAETPQPPASTPSPIRENAPRTDNQSGPIS